MQGDGEANHYGAFINKQLVAVVTWDVKKGVGNIRKLAVLDEARRQGIATQLVLYCLKQMLIEGVVCCSLLANLTSVTFYQRLGFVSVDEKVQRGDCHYVRMELGLIN